VIEEGLHYIHLRPTWNFDQKWVKQPLRDLCRPAQAKFALAESSEPAERSRRGGSRAVRRIAFLEVLENDDTVFAVDPQDEYLRCRNDMVLLAIERRAMNRVAIDRQIDVVGCDGRWLGRRPTRRCDGRRKRAGEFLRINTNVDRYVRCGYVAIRKADIDKPSWAVDTNLIKTRVNVKQVIDKGIYSESYEDGLSLTVSRCWKQAEDPLSLEPAVATFSVPVRPKCPRRFFHMRAITESGKVTTAGRWYCRKAKTGKPTHVSLYSDTAARRLP